MAEHPTPWRTGQHPVDEPGPRGRTLYDADGELIGVMDSHELAERVVAAVDALESLRSEARAALYLTPLGEVMGRGVMAEDVPTLAKMLGDG